ncbi:MAG TPA: hypothetical protein VNN72_20555 [Polyangiaceae bacterium]|nr:hypothetical protein [Polyangiaceae bacterium]
MRSKIIVVNAGIVILVALLSYVLLATSLKGLASDPAERKREVERSLRAASAQLALDALRLERWLEKSISSEATRGVYGLGTPEARQQAGLSEANRLRDLAQNDPQFAGIPPSLVALVDDQGVVISRDGSNLMRGESLAKAYPALGEALKSGRAGSAVWINRQRQEQLLVSYGIVRNETGVVQGAVVIGTPLNDERITRTSELTSGSVLIVARASDKGLEAVADSAGAASAAAMSAATTAPVAAAARAAIANKGIASADAPIGGNLFGVMPVDGYGPTDAVIITAVPASRVESPVAFLWPVLAVGALGLVMVVFAGFMLGNYISQPVSELEDGLLAIINGQQDLRFQIEHDELGGLVFRINSLLNAMTGVPEDTTDDQGRPSKAPSASDFQDPA